MVAAAQAQITTKKIKISDFPEKTTKVVLTGNALYDAVLKEEIATRWRIAPYEFCTLQEFNELKGKNNYYFLVTTKGQFKTESEPGLQFLTLVKGGEEAENGINEMLEIVSLPIASAENPSGSYHVEHICSVFTSLHERAAALEFPLGRTLHGRRSVLRQPRQTVGRLKAGAWQRTPEWRHSHSIVAGGFGVMSQTTRFAPFTLVAIFSATMVTNLNGSSTMPAFTNCCVEMARMPMT